MGTLKERLEEIAKSHAARKEALGSAITPEIHSAISAAAEDHAAQQFANALAAGVAEDAAMEKALAEADRQRKHLIQATLLQADPQVQKKDLLCANEGKVTPHALLADANGEVVATCGCGRFRKFAQGAPIEDAAA